MIWPTVILPIASGNVSMNMQFNYQEMCEYILPKDPGTTCQPVNVIMQPGHTHCTNLQTGHHILNMGTSEVSDIRKLSQ